MRRLQQTLPGLADENDDHAAARELVLAGLPPNTCVTYERCYEDFARYAGKGALPATPQTVVAYLTRLFRNGKSYDTLRVHKSAIAFYHGLHGYPDPNANKYVRIAWTSIVKRTRLAPDMTDALTRAEFERLLLTLDAQLENAAGSKVHNVARARIARDRAFLLIMYDAALSCSEALSLTIGTKRATLLDIDGGKLLRIARFYGDDDPKEVVVHYRDDRQRCAARALDIWLDTAQIEAGDVFRPIDLAGTIGPKAMKPRAARALFARLCAQAHLPVQLFSLHSVRMCRLVEESLRPDGDIQELARLADESMPRLRKAIENTITAQKQRAQAMTS